LNAGAVGPPSPASSVPASGASQPLEPKTATRTLSSLSWPLKPSTSTIEFSEPLRNELLKFSFTKAPPSASPTTTASALSTPRGASHFGCALA
jgi:hypothetical protein